MGERLQTFASNMQIANRERKQFLEVENIPPETNPSFSNKAHELMLDFGQAMAMTYEKEVVSEDLLLAVALNVPGIRGIERVIEEGAPVAELEQQVDKFIDLFFNTFAENLRKEIAEDVKPAFLLLGKKLRDLLPR